MRLDKGLSLVSSGPYPTSGGAPGKRAMVPTSSSGTAPHHEGPPPLRTLGKGLRLLTLTRGKGETYGFHLSGGQDNGTGFFISHVEPGSLAQKQGIRAGDQVLEVGGRPVARLVHRQVADTIAATLAVTLLLREAGMVPVQGRNSDALSWVMIDGDAPSSRPPANTKAPLTSKDSTGSSGGGSVATSAGAAERRFRVVVPTQGKTSLGFSITRVKGGGAVVAAVRRGGVASAAGLRRHDRILACNGRILDDLEHSQVIAELKQLPQLILDVLRPVRGEGAGPVGAWESSGYNSSASSNTGDQSPPSGRRASGGPRRQGARRPVEPITTLTAASHRLQQREAALRSVEGEWADAEAEEKRRALGVGRKEAGQGAYRKDHPMSRSASDLLELSQYDCSSDYHSAGGFASAINTNLATKSTLRSASSTINLNNAHHNHHSHHYNQSRLLSGRRMAATSSSISDDESVVTTSAYTSGSRYSISGPCSANSNSSSAPNYHHRRQQEKTYGGTAGDHKIAVLTNTNQHVNIVVTPSSSRYRDEADAVGRLEELSYPSSEATTLTRDEAASVGSVAAAAAAVAAAGPYGGHDVAPDHAAELVDRQLQRIKEQKRLLAKQEELLVRERTRFETRHLTASSRSPSPSYRSPPSPSPSSSSAGRHTSRIHIKSTPPAPPKRHTSTALSRPRRGYSPSCHECCHSCHSSTTALLPKKHGSLARQKPSRHHQSSTCLTYQYTQPRRRNHCDCHHYNHSHHHRNRGSSPPSSPSSSSGVSCGSNPHHSSLPRRCKSFDELSHSSDEDTVIWDDVGVSDHFKQFNHQHNPCHHHRTTNTTTTSNNKTPQNSLGINDSSPPPPPPPKPNPSNTFDKSQCGATSKMHGFNGPRQPPPPPSMEVVESPRTNLASALAQALRQRNLEDTNGANDSERAEAYQAKIDAYKKEHTAPKDVKQMQHEKLMEEFKLKHRKMFNADDNSGSSAPSDSSTSNVEQNTGPETYIISKSQLSHIPITSRKTASPSITQGSSTTSSVDTITKKKEQQPFTPARYDVPAAINNAEPIKSMIVIRSMSSNLRSAPTKPPAGRLVNSKEDKREESEGNALTYWKKKDEAVKAPALSKSKSKVAVTTTMSFTSSTSFKKSFEETNCIKSDATAEAFQDENVVSEPRSAKDIIKTFNSSADVKQDQPQKVTNIYLNSLKGAKDKAPQPPSSSSSSSSEVSSSVSRPPQHRGGISPSTSKSQLVKTQSWIERSGGSSSIVHISHSEEESSREYPSFQKRFPTNDSSTSNFNAMFTSSQKTVSSKPLVSIDAYGSSNSKPSPQKIDFLASGESNEHLNKSSDSDFSDKSKLQMELSSTLVRSNLREKSVSNASSNSSGSSSNSGSAR